MFSASEVFGLPGLPAGGSMFFCCLKNDCLALFLIVPSSSGFGLGELVFGGKVLVVG